MHLGDREWMIVDSCVAPDDTIPVLDYLSGVGADAAVDVKLVVATHWHDDHVRGISRVLQTCEQARFACSGVLSPKQLVEAIGALRSAHRFDARRTTSGVDEMRRTLELLKPGNGRPAALWSVEGLPLFRRTDPRCEVTALAPGQRALSIAYQQIAPLVREGVRGRVPKPNENLGAVVLWVQVGDVSLLLGADLEETPDPQTGWTAVCDCAMRPGGRAEVFKVPHHGSKNGHQHRVWDELLVVSPEHVVCPHSLAGNHLPTPEDIQRLCQLGPVHLTRSTRSRVCSPSWSTDSAGDFYVRARHASSSYVGEGRVGRHVRPTCCRPLSISALVGKSTRGWLTVPGGIARVRQPRGVVVAASGRQPKSRPAHRCFSCTGHRAGGHEPGPPHPERRRSSQRRGRSVAVRRGRRPSSSQLCRIRRGSNWDG